MQDKTVFESPWEHIKDLRFTLPFLAIMGVAQLTWLFDAYIRERLKLSQTYAFTALISAPISVVSMLVVLWLSEKLLADKIVWWAAGLVALGTLLSMIGAAYMLSGN
jgi:di/tricarboxylate transporter